MAWVEMATVVCFVGLVAGCGSGTDSPIDADGSSSSAGEDESSGAASEATGSLESTGSSAGSSSETAETGDTGETGEPGDECSTPFDCAGYEFLCQERLCVNGYCVVGEADPDGSSCAYTDDQDYPGFCVGGYCQYECSNNPEDPNYRGSGEPTACTYEGCELGSCAGTEELDGVDADEEFQIAGDCKVLHCVAGTPNDEPAAEDVEDDENDCTLDACDGTRPTHEPEPLGTPCGAAGQCDGAGACVAP